jgi:hypothetical protein
MKRASIRNVCFKWLFTARTGTSVRACLLHGARAAVLARSTLTKVDHLVAESALIAVEAGAGERRDTARAGAVHARAGRARVVGQLAACARIAGLARASEEGQRESGGASAGVEAGLGIAADVAVAESAGKRIVADALVAQIWRRGEHACAVVATRTALAEVDGCGARGARVAERAHARVAVELRDAEARVVAGLRGAEVDRELAVGARVAGGADARVAVEGLDARAVVLAGRALAVVDAVLAASARERGVAGACE